MKRLKVGHWAPYPHPHPHPPPHGSFIGGLLVGGLATLATVAIIDMALDDAREQYKDETGEDMPACGQIPSEKFVRDKDGEMMCSDTADGSQICFYKNRKSDKENRMCYVP